jgi:hypothetical protein
MKTLLLSLALVLNAPAFSAEPATTPSGVKVAKKKEKKAEAPPKKKAEPKKSADKK